MEKFLCIDIGGTAIKYGAVSYTHLAGSPAGPLEELKEGFNRVKVWG